MNRMNSMTPDHLSVSKAPKQVQNWQKSLLDLSLRNPLINRVSRHAVELRVPPALIGEFEDLVNDKEYIALAAGRHRPAELSDEGLQQEQTRAVSLLKERTVEVELTTNERVHRLRRPVLQPGPVVSAEGAAPQETATLLPSTSRSTGLFGSALAISARRRPETRTSPASSTVAGMCELAETS